MLATQVPTKFPVPFAQGAGPPYSRPIPLSTTDQNAASLTLGFPPNTFVNVNSGGSEPDGRDFNGVLNQLSAWSQWQAAGGPIYYDATFATAIGGYPQGALLMATSRANLWVSSVDNNTTNPDTGGANWVQIGASPNLTALFATAVQNETWIYVHDTGTADALVVNPSPAVTSLVAGLRLSVLKGGFANATTTPTVNVNSLGAKTIVRSNNTPIQANDLPANAIFDLEYDGANFRLLQLQPTAVRRRLAANTTFFVSTTGSDVTGNGTSGTPWQTIQNAFNQIYQNYDLAGFTVTIQLANGTYTAGVLWDGLFLGQIGPIVLSGNTSNPDLVRIYVVGAACFHFRYGANIFVQGFRLQCGLSGVGFGGMMAEFGGYISHDFCWFDAMAGCNHMFANYGTITCFNPLLAAFGHYWIYGNAINHYYCQFNGNIDVRNATITTGAACAFTTFCNTPNGNCWAGAATYSLPFGVTGQRYNCAFAGYANVNLAGVNFFPGSIAGSIAGGGFYQ